MKMRLTVLYGCASLDSSTYRNWFAFAVKSARSIMPCANVFFCWYTLTSGITIYLCVIQETFNKLPSWTVIKLTGTPANPASKSVDPGKLGLLEPPSGGRGEARSMSVPPLSSSPKRGPKFGLKSPSTESCLVAESSSSSPVKKPPSTPGCKSGVFGIRFPSESSPSVSVSIQYKIKY